MKIIIEPSVHAAAMLDFYYNIIFWPIEKNKFLT